MWSLLIQLYASLKDRSSFVEYILMNLSEVVSSNDMFIFKITSTIWGRKIDKPRGIFQWMTWIIDLTLVVCINWIFIGNSRCTSLILYPNQLLVYKSMLFSLPICHLLCSFRKKKKCLMPDHIEEEIWCMIDFLCLEYLLISIEDHWLLIANNF